MSSSVCDEEHLSSFASLPPPLSLKSGTLELPHYFDPINIEIISTPEPTIEIKYSFCKTPIVNIQPTSSTPKTRNSPTPPPNNFQVNLKCHLYRSHQEKNIYSKFMSSLPLVFFLLCIKPSEKSFSIHYYD